MVNSESISCVICSRPIEPKFDLLPSTQQFEASQSATLRCFNFRQDPYVGSTYISSFSQDSDIRSIGIYCPGCRERNGELLHLLQELVSVEEKIESVMKNVRVEFHKNLEQLEELKQRIPTTQGNQKKICQLRLELLKSPEVNLSSLHGKLPVSKQVTPSTPVPLELEESGVFYSTRNQKVKKLSPKISDQDDSNSFFGGDDNAMDYFEDNHVDESETVEPAQLNTLSPPHGTTSATASEALLLKQFGINECHVKIKPLNESLLKSLGIKKGRSYPCLFKDCDFSTHNFSLLDRNKHLNEVHHLNEIDIVALDALTQKSVDVESNVEDDESDSNSDSGNDEKWFSTCFLDDCTVDDHDAYKCTSGGNKVKGHKNRKSLLNHLQKRHGLTLRKAEITRLIEERRAKTQKRLASLKPTLYECWLADCPETDFQSKAELEKHMEDAHPELPSTKARNTICKIWACKRRFITIEDRDTHIVECHGGLETYILCPNKVCQFFLPSAEALETHLKENHREKRHFCSFCGAGFISTLYLDKHIAKKHFDKKFTCLYMECTESFDTIHKRDVHIGSAHGDTVGFVRCIRPCRRRFPTQEDLDQHKQNRHKIHKDLACPICDFKFLSQLMLDRHVKAHAPGDAEKFQNKQPRRIYKGKWRTVKEKSDSEVQKSGRTRTTGPPREREYTASGKIRRFRPPKKKLWFYCNVCNAECRTENDLRLHKATVHLKFQCDACGAAFKCHSGLNYHVKAFHDQKFQNLCDLCGKSFLRPSQRDMHYKSVHMGERSFACDMCDKTYSASSNLRYHKVKHHGLPTTKRGPMPRYGKRPQDYRYPIAAASAKRKAEADSSAALATDQNDQSASQPKAGTKAQAKAPSVPSTSTAATATSGYSSRSDVAAQGTSAAYIPNGSGYFHQGPQQPTYSAAYQPQEINYQQLNYMMQQAGFPHNVPR